MVVCGTAIIACLEGAVSDKKSQKQPWLLQLVLCPGLLSGNIQIVRLLLSVKLLGWAGGVANTVCMLSDCDGQTPLQMAVMKGDGIQ